MGLLSKLFGTKTKEGTVKLKYINTITTTLDVEFDEIEDAKNVKTKSINFIGKFLLINDIEVPHFKLIDASDLTKKWATEDKPSLMSHEIVVNLIDKEVYYTVFVPTIDGGIPVEDGLMVKPTKQTFTYNKDVTIENITLLKYSVEANALIEMSWAEDGNYELISFIEDTKDSLQVGDDFHFSDLKDKSFTGIIKTFNEENTLWADQVMNETEGSVIRQATYNAITNDLVDEYIENKLVNVAYSAYVLMMKYNSIVPEIIKIIEEENLDIIVPAQTLADRVFQMMQVKAVFLTENKQMRSIGVS